MATKVEGGALNKMKNNNKNVVFTILIFLCTSFMHFYIIVLRIINQIYHPKYHPLYLQK
jgi:hypothetical protein